MTEPQVLPPLVVQQLPPQNTLRWQVVTFLRQLAVAVVTSVIIIGGLVIGFHGQTQEEVQRQETTINSNLAIACVLSLPVDPAAGRDPDGVTQCFTQYKLDPPILPR